VQEAQSKWKNEPRADGLSQYRGGRRAGSAAVAAGPPSDASMLRDLGAQATYRVREPSLKHAASD